MRLSHAWLRGARLLLVGMCGLWLGCGAIIWEFDYERGVATARQTRRRALVEFYSGLDRECLTMDRSVFGDPDVQRMMGRFVAIRLDPLLFRDLARQWDLEAVPSFAVIRPDGSMAGSSQGGMTAEEFRLFLIKHAYN